MTDAKGALMSTKHHGVVMTYNSGERRPTAWRHWTPEGTIQVFYTMIGLPPPMAAFYFRGEFVELGASPEALVALIREGKFDLSLGVSLSALGVPAELWNWNNWENGPRYEVPYG